MKKLTGILVCLLLVLLCAAALADVKLDEKHFPDKIFREHLKMYVDQDGNGVLSDKEISGTKYMDLYGTELKDVTGLKYFTNLESLTVNGSVKTIDLSKNTKLTYLTVISKLTALDVSHNTKLKTLICYGNKFKKLDVSKCPELVKLVQNKKRSYDPNGVGNHFWSNRKDDMYGDLAVNADVTVIAGKKTSKPSDVVTVHDPYVVYSVDLKVTAPKAGQKSTKKAKVTETTGKSEVESAVWLTSGGKEPSEPYTFEPGKKYKLKLHLEGTGKRYKFCSDVKVTAAGAKVKEVTVVPYKGDTDANWLEVVLSVQVLAKEVTVSGGVYKLDNDKLTATFIKPEDKNATSLKIHTKISANGNEYKVTAIADKACAGCEKLKKVSIGGSVSKIGASAFKDCKKLEKIEIKTAQLKKGSIGDKAFKGIKSKAVFKCPKNKVKLYKEIFRKAGASDKATFK